MDALLSPTHPLLRVQQLPERTALPGILCLRARRRALQVATHPLQLGDLSLQHFGLRQQCLAIQGDAILLRQRQPDLLQ